MLKKAKDFQMPKKLQYDPKKSHRYVRKVYGRTTGTGFWHHVGEFAAPRPAFIAGRFGYHRREDQRRPS